MRQQIHHTEKKHKNSKHDTEEQMNLLRYIGILRQLLCKHLLKAGAKKETKKLWWPQIFSISQWGEEEGDVGQ